MSSGNHEESGYYFDGIFYSLCIDECFIFYEKWASWEQKITIQDMFAIGQVMGDFHFNMAHQFNVTLNQIYSVVSMYKLIVLINVVMACCKFL